MKSIVFSVLLFLLFFVNSFAKIYIVSTVKPIGDIAKEIGGEKVKVDYIIPPSVSFHNYEYKFSDMKKLLKANIFLYIGSGEPNIRGMLKNVKGKAIKVSKIKGVYTINRFEFENSDKHQNHQHNNIDEKFHPALWLDPSNAIAIGNYLAKVLAKMDPSNKKYYLERAKKFEIKVRRVMYTWEMKYRNLKHKDFVSYHYTFPYFTKAFGLNYVAVIELGHGREPTIKHIIKVSKILRKRNIKFVFFAKQFYNPKYISMLKKSVNVRTIALDPFGVNKNYVEMLEFNLKRIYYYLNK